MARNSIVYCVSTLHKAYKRQRGQLWWMEKAETLTLALIACAVLLEYTARYLGYNSGLLFRLMVEGNSAELYTRLARLGMSVVSSAVLISLRKFVVSSLSRVLRRVWAVDLLGSYFGVQQSYTVGLIPMFYRILCDGSLDNPDQRLTHDLREFCRLSIQALDQFLLAPLMITIYSRDVYQKNGLKALLIVYGMFGIGTIIQSFTVPRLVAQNKRLDRLEGDYRGNHTEVCRNGEFITLAGKSGNIHHAVQAGFGQVDRQAGRVLRWQLVVDMVGNMFAYLGGVLNYFILYWTLNFDQNIPAGELTQYISQSSFRVMYLISKLTELVQVGSLISDLMTFSQRVLDLQDSLDKQNKLAMTQVTTMLETQKIVTEPSGSLTLSRLSVRNPVGSLLFKDLDLTIHKDANVYIKGPNGVGKTSIARTVMGLWPPEQGSITFKGGSRIICCPQEAVMHDGSLSSLITDKSPTAEPTDKEYLKEVLLSVGLDPEALVGSQMDITLSQGRWVERLSPGQRQRLAIARLIIEKPDYAILDETTVSMDPATEHLMHTLLWREGICTITIGHRVECDLVRDSRIKYLLVLDGKGGHSVHQL